MAQDVEDIDEQLKRLQQQTSEQSALGNLRTANRLANEIRRTAKAERRLIPYLDAGFRIMVDGPMLFSPEQARDVAIDMISFLESRDRALNFQPDCPEADYEHAVHWMSACAYDNLAKSTGSIHGYNSDGMHQCINDGIQVCRRTGKLECVTCFREYATDVYLASDDLDMARHFARLGMTHEHPGPHDRRWVGAYDLLQIQLLAADLDGALETAVQVAELIETFHTPRHSLIKSRLALEALSAITGIPGASNLPEIHLPLTGEYPWLDMRGEQQIALEASLVGNHQQAIRALQKWDRVLLEKRCISEFFRNRLRLISVLRLAGQDKAVSELGLELKRIATSARDWLTLRLLDRALDPHVDPVPVPALADYPYGPWAKKRKQTKAAHSPRDSMPLMGSTGLNPSPEQPHEEQDVEPRKEHTGEQPDTNSSAVAADGADTDSKERTEKPAPEQQRPPTALLESCWERILASQRIDDTDKFHRLHAEVERDLLASPLPLANDDEAAWLLNTMRFVLHPASDAKLIWDWGNRIFKTFPGDASCMNLLATLGAYLRFGDHGAAELVSEQELESLFRQSLDLDPHRWRSYERAGTFFNFRGELGEAERCFARAFRLVRNESSVALPLAEIYSRTDRHRDAIAVLDLCLREGSEDPNVPYRAAILAHQLKRFDATLSYLGRFTSEMPATPWIYYYRASSLLESQRYDETLQTIAQQEKEFPEFATVILIMRASALGGLKDLDGLHKALDAIMQLSLRDVDYLSIAGLAQVTRRLWLESECLPDDDLRKVQLCDLLLASGLAPNELFRPQRLAREKQTGLVYAECHVRQPLNRLWSQSSACLHGQENWTAYDITWGVLAQNQETAEQWVLDWQSRCYGVPGEVREVKVLDSGFTDHPGVVWQGAREGVSPEMGG